MAKAKHGYTWPARSRAAMIDYLSDHESYVPMSTWNGGFVLAWNIKVHMNFDTDGMKHTKEFSFRENRTEAWERIVQVSDDMFWRVCEEQLWQYTQDEWTNYPGIEQGEWKFGVNGRSGGYLILTDAPSWLNGPRGWRSCAMTWDSRDAYTEWLKTLPFEQLKKFYRAIRVLDHDLRRDAIRDAMEYGYAFLRSQWEEEQDEKEDCAVAKMELSRPDMYQPGV